MVTVLAPAKRFLSVGTVARMVGCSPTTLREMESRGLLPFVPARLDGVETRLYTPEDVVAIKAAREALRRQRPHSGEREAA